MTYGRVRCDRSDFNAETFEITAIPRRAHRPWGLTLLLNAETQPTPRQVPTAIGPAVINDPGQSGRQDTVRTFSRAVAGWDAGMRLRLDDGTPSQE